MAGKQVEINKDSLAELHKNSFATSRDIKMAPDGSYEVENLDAGKYVITGRYFDPVSLKFKVIAHDADFTEADAEAAPPVPLDSVDPVSLAEGQTLKVNIGETSLLGANKKTASFRFIDENDNFPEKLREFGDLSELCQLIVKKPVKSDNPLDAIYITAVGGETSANGSVDITDAQLRGIGLTPGELAVEFLMQSSEIVMTPHLAVESQTKLLPGQFVIVHDSGKYTVKSTGDELFPVTDNDFPVNQWPVVANMKLKPRDDTEDENIVVFDLLNYNEFTFAFTDEAQVKIGDEFFDITIFEVGKPSDKVSIEQFKHRPKETKGDEKGEVELEYTVRLKSKLAGGNVDNVVVDFVFDGSEHENGFQSVVRTPLTAKITDGTHEVMVPHNDVLVSDDIPFASGEGKLDGSIASGENNFRQSLSLRGIKFGEYKASLDMTSTNKQLIEALTDAEDRSFELTENRWRQDPYSRLVHPVYAQTTVPSRGTIELGASSNYNAPIVLDLSRNKMMSIVSEEVVFKKEESGSIQKEAKYKYAKHVLMRVFLGFGDIPLRPGMAAYSFMKTYDCMLFNEYPSGGVYDPTSRLPVFRKGHSVPLASVIGKKLTSKLPDANGKLVRPSDIGYTINGLILEFSLPQVGFLNVSADDSVTYYLGIKKTIPGGFLDSEPFSDPAVSFLISKRSKYSEVDANPGFTVKSFEDTIGVDTDAKKYAFLKITIDKRFIWEEKKAVDLYHELSLFEPGNAGKLVDSNTRFSGGDGTVEESQLIGL